MEANTPKDFYEQVLKDVVDITSKAETQEFFEVNFLKPILQRVFQHLYPYIIGVMTLWILMFIFTSLILILFVRGSLFDRIGKQ